MPKPTLVISQPTNNQTFKLTDGLPLVFKVPLGNPPSVTIHVTDDYGEHYLLKEPRLTLLPQLITIPPYQSPLLKVSVAPDAAPYFAALPMPQFVGFHLLRILAIDTAVPADFREYRVPIRVVYP